MTSKIVAKRQQHQDQIAALIAKFTDRHKKHPPKLQDWAKLCRNMRRCVGKMTPTLLEDVITLRETALLEDLIGKENLPRAKDELLPLDFIVGEFVTDDDGTRRYVPGVRLSEIEDWKNPANSYLADEDLTPFAYAIAYALAGPKFAQQIPQFNP